MGDDLTPRLRPLPAAFADTVAALHRVAVKYDGPAMVEVMTDPDLV